MATTGVAYVRVSTREQAQEGVSVESQVEKIRAYARFNEIELLDIVVDLGVSGGKELHRREGGCRLLGMMNKVDAVISTKLDRLFRDAADCLVRTKSWDQKGVALHLLDFGGTNLDTSSPMGRMFLTVAAAMAEMERALARERTQNAMDHKRSKSQRISRHVPFGHDLADDGQTLVENPREQRAIQVMRRMRERKASYQRIADRLSAFCIPTKQGKPRWSQRSVQTILKRPVVAMA